MAWEVENKYINTGSVVINNSLVDNEETNNKPIILG